MIEIKKGITKDEVQATYSHPSITKLSNDHYAPSFIDHEEVYYYSCYVDGEYCGCFVLWSNFYKEVEIHSLLLPNAIRHERELSGNILNIAFTDNDRVTTKIFDKIKTTINLIKKLGFTHEGTLRNSYVDNGKHGNIELFGLLKSEWESKNERNR